jgi:hypothetical protein
MLGGVSVGFGEAGRLMVRWASLSTTRTSVLLYAVTRIESGIILALYSCGLVLMPTGTIECCAVWGFEFHGPDVMNVHFSTSGSNEGSLL